ncbi:GGDEF domain-containing protein [Devosia rhodophyticola]|uniref:diguanylate cyclase n=1 Tax=Devosia rhodophyticola TaxID=3026423 RepID=A0ABY7YUN6_9HYPH|nr:GGDEF domain-containing protein [Devosia rhodophyticola]WDR04922.1 GGDEF domain-containing protein [Devosia rhodophyticola]
MINIALASPKTWSSVIRLTILATVASLLVSLLFNALAFGDLGQRTLQRSLISALVAPLLIGAPLFFIIGWRWRSLALANSRLGDLARTDSLTECLNRGAFADRVEDLLAGTGMEMATGSFLMIDADNFKTINDRYGHEAGDQALRIIVRSIRTILRRQDIIGRMGGEEFAVYLPETALADAAVMAERIRRAVNLAVFTPTTVPHQLSISIGGVAFDTPTNFARLFSLADYHLYAAKNDGRNCINLIQADDTETTPDAIDAHLG